MIAFSNVSKQYGRQVLFVDASFQLNPSEKVGLVGPNGSGKTTLFRMIAGEEHPDDGDVSVPAVSKHVKVLAVAGLVSQTKVAQRRPCHLEAEVFDLMTKWIDRYRRAAQERYDRLDAVLADMRDDGQTIHHPHQGAAS